MRAFLAIEIPEDVKARLVECQRALERAGWHRYRWTPEDQLHLTLIFIAELPEASVEEMLGVMTGTCARLPRFTLHCRGVGTFDRRHPDGVESIVWAGIEPNDGLTSLRSRLFDNIQMVTPTREAERFHPHVTLGRPRRGASSGAMEDEPPEFGSWTVESISLIESVLDSDGVIYARRGHAKLQGG